MDFRMLREGFQSRFGVRPGDEKIEIAHGFLAAAQAARRRHRLDPGDRLQEGDHLVGHAVGEAQQEPSGALAIGRDRAEDLFL